MSSFLVTEYKQLHECLHPLHFHLLAGMAEVWNLLTLHKGKADEFHNMPVWSVLYVMSVKSIQNYLQENKSAK